ncbi:MAG: endonuclease III domain-containing protein [Candidatus Hydrogenedentota bacterium]
MTKRYEKSAALRARLEKAYECMAAHYGPTHWWPGDTPFEIAIGAILTQNTAWRNVEQAITTLKARNLLTVEAMLSCPAACLEQAIRPTGYFRQKAKRLQTFCAWLRAHYGGDMARMAQEPLDTLRPALLAINGIGPETADDILLYACGKPVFVIDAYTRRIVSRHGWAPDNLSYEALRVLFEEHMEPAVHTFREYHGLVVYTAKAFCRKRDPLCEGCPLEPLLPKDGPRR